MTMGKVIDFNKLRNINLNKTSNEILENFINESLKQHDPEVRDQIEAEVRGVLAFLGSYEIPCDETMEFTEKQWEFINKYYEDLVKTFICKAGVIATELIRFQVGHYK